MLNQVQLINQVSLLKKELQNQIPLWLDQVLEKIGYKNIPKQTLDQIKQDMGIEWTDPKQQFVNVFPQALLQLTTTHNNGPKEVQTVQQLLLYAQSYFNENNPVIRKFDILKEIVSDLNKCIQGFFRERKQKIHDLSNQEKQIIEQIQKKYTQTYLNHNQQQKLNESNKNEPFKKEEAKIILKQEKQDKRQPSPQCVITQIQPPEKCPHCLCGKSLINVTTFVQTSKSPILKCRICDNYFHTVCLKILNTNGQSQFFCPACVILRLDPLHKIIDVLCQPVAFRPTQHAPTKTFTFTLGEKNPNTQVELRCIKLDGKGGQEEPTWPDVGDVQINGKKVIEFKPLQTNSSLKKRKDEKLSTRDVLYNTSNVIQIREGIPSADQKMNCRVSLGQVYFIGVFLVHPLQPQQFIQEVKGAEENWMTIEQCKENIRLYIERCSAADFQVQSLSVTLTCYFDFKLISTPVRGNLCEHLQCFSLENMIQMMNRVSPRRWRCPICKAKCFEFVIDSLQYFILQKIKENKLKIEECSFNGLGNIEQQNLQEMVTDQNIKQLMPPHAITNNNKIIQLDWLRSKQTVKAKQKNDESEKLKQQVEPTPRKRVCNDSKENTQQLNQIYPEEQYCGKSDNPIFVE